MFQQDQKNSLSLPNKVYVGITRAKQKLYIFSKMVDNLKERREAQSEFRREAKKEGDNGKNMVPRHLPSFLEGQLGFFDIVRLCDDDKIIVNVKLDPRPRKKVISMQETALVQTPLVVIDDFMKSQMNLQRIKYHPRDDDTKSGAENNIAENNIVVSPSHGVNGVNGANDANITNYTKSPSFDTNDTFTFEQNINVQTIVECTKPDGPVLFEDVSTLNGDLVTLI